MLSALKVAARFSAITKARSIGTCGFCEQEVKCPRGTLAHHGYRRPGYGYIEGSCPGTHHPPFEVSPKTAEIGVSTYSKTVKELTKRLRELPKVKVLLVKEWRSSTPKELRKDEAEPDEWRQAYGNIEHGLKRDLKESERWLDRYEKKVRGWEPAQVKTVEEEVAKKRQRAEVVRAQRMERYVTNRDKTIGRLHKAFKKVQDAERKLKSARDAKSIWKALTQAAKGAHIIYGTYVSKPSKLQQNHPDPVSKDDVCNDMGLDEMWEHMGLKTSSGYVKWAVANEWESKAFSGDNEERGWLWLGLDYWKPFWPGWKGSIDYPLGSKGRSDGRHSW